VAILGASTDPLAFQEELPNHRWLPRQGQAAVVVEAPTHELAQVTLVAVEQSSQLRAQGVSVDERGATLRC
jgi:hypothetical protein